MKNRKFLSMFLLTEMYLSIHSAAPAATKTWDTVQGDGVTITGGSGDWSNGGVNWNSTGDSTWDNAAPDSAVFSTGSGTVTLTSAITANKLTFNSGTSYTITSNTITLVNVGDPVIAANESATINSDITLSNAQTWNVASGKTLTLGGTVNATAAGTAYGLQGQGSFLFNGSIGSNVGNVLFNGGAGSATTVTFTQANSFTGQLWLGNGGGSAQTLNFSDVNQLGTGTGANFIAIQNGSTLRYTGTGSQATAARDLFWNAGNATIDITNAAANLTFNITGGSRNLTFTKAGAGQLTLSKSTAIDELTSNSLTINGGTLEYNQNNAGAISRFAGTVTGAAGTYLKVTGTGYIGNENLAANWSANLASLDVGTGAAFDLRGNITTVAALTGSGTVRNSYVNSLTDSGNVGNTLIVGANNGSGQFDGVLRGSLTGIGDHTGDSGGANGLLNLTKIGSGTQVLTGPNSYTGATLINGGTLQVNGSLANASAVTVAGGTLGGTGTVGAVTIQNGGAIAPGNSAGTFNVGNLTLQSNAVFAVEINGDASYDKLNVTGTVNLTDSTLSLSLGYTPTLGTQFTIIQNDLADTVTGTFGSILNGSGFTINYGGGDGNDVVLTYAIPEPSTWMLVALALVPLFLRRRR